MRLSTKRTAHLGGVTICLTVAAASAPWFSVKAQIIVRPGVSQPALPPSLPALPDLTAVILYVPTRTIDPFRSPAGLQGGREGEGTVTLRVNATGTGAVIALSSAHSALRAPATVTVPAGASSVKFRYDLLPVAEPTTAMVSATYNKQTKTDSVQILPPALEAFTLDSRQVEGGKPVSGLVKLNGVGPADKDVRIALGSNHPAGPMTAEILLRGVQEKAFSFGTKGVGQPTEVLVSASLRGGKREVAVTLLPASLRHFGGYGYFPQGPSNQYQIVWFDTSSCDPNSPPEGVNHRWGYHLSS